MTFIDDILNNRSVSIIGTAKNTGKTVCLNYILSQAKSRGRQLAVTSIGVDGESRDAVTMTEKPEIELSEGMIFVTSEKHYREKRLTAEIIDVSAESTALGRLITARVITSGKVLLSGPSSTSSLAKMIERMKQLEVDTTLVDGAISRMSLASPTITDAMVLTTGAATSRNIPELVRKTRFVYDLICLEAVESELAQKLAHIDSGLWAVDETGIVHDLNISSVLLTESSKENIFRYGNTIFAAGFVSDRTFSFLQVQRQIGDTTLIVKDFTKIFVSPQTYYSYLNSGGSVKVLAKSRLLAVCVNPISPDGYKLDSKRLCEAMSENLGVAVYDVKQLRNQD